MLRRAAYAVLGYNILVILWGAFVRATGSGAGCGSHWPTCNGEVVPRAESVETAIELTHRLTSGVAFLFVLALMIAALIRRPKGHPMRPWAVASFVFMVLEAAVGAGLVLLELVADNQSAARAGWIAVHLVNTFFLVAALTMTALCSAPDAERVRLQGKSSTAWIVGLALAGTMLVGVSGAITALGDTLFPARSLAEGLAQDVSPGAHFLIRLRVWHPILAVIVALYALGAAGMIAFLRPDPRVRRAAIAVAALFVLQIGLGFLNVLLLAPTWMQLVHLLVADAIWIALVTLGATALRGNELERVEQAPAVMPAG
jgi:heme A synthase